MLQSWITTAVLVLLVFLSILTWTIGIAKMRSLKAALQLDDLFLQERPLVNLHSFKVESSSALTHSDLFKLRQEIAPELAKLKGVTNKKSALIAVVERKLGQAIAGLMKQHERGHSELATIGSSAPFIGLFGTVWGIMDALKNISLSGHVSIEVVAGPVGEALITTAIGIATALPAVYFYNHIARQLQLRHSDLEKFSSQMVNVLIEEE